MIQCPRSPAFPSVLAKARLGESLTQTQTHPTLVVTGGELDGTSFIVLLTSKDMLLGSSQDCHFQILLGNVDAVPREGHLGPQGPPPLRCALLQRHLRQRGEDRREPGPERRRSDLPRAARVEELVQAPGPHPARPGVARRRAKTWCWSSPRGASSPSRPGPRVSSCRARTAPPTSPRPTVDLRATGPSPIPPPPTPPPAAPFVAERARARAEEGARPRVRHRAAVDRPPEGERQRGRPAPRPAAPSGGKGGGQAGRDSPAGRGPPLYAVAALLLAAGAFFGFRVFFRSPPVIDSAAPARSEPGQTITLAGKGFDHERGRQHGEVRRPDGAGFDRGRQPARGDDPCRPAHSRRGRDQDRGRVAGQALEAVLVQGLPCARG